MKKTITIISLILITGISIAYISTTGSEPVEEEITIRQEKPKVKESCCAGDMETMSSKQLSENSIYQVNSTWKNQFGNDVNITELKGKTQVFTMIFANCTYACPILINDMKRIEEKLSKGDLNNVQFTLVSIDPERDTPAKLKEFAMNQNLNLGRWQLLTGSRSDIDDLAALLGFRYKKENDGSFSHSNIITILNKEGEVVHQQIGLTQDISQSISIIKNTHKEGV